MKILCLGNEFIKEDSLAKEIANDISDEFEFINIKDSFELLDYFKNEESLIILDVVKDLKDVKILGIDDLSQNKIISAHDFDAGFFLKLLGNKEIKIIGIPTRGNFDKIKNKVYNHLTFKK